MNKVKQIQLVKKVFYLILILFVFFTNFHFIFAEENNKNKYISTVNNKNELGIVYKNKLYVKFKSNSLLGHLWKSQNKSGELTPLVGILGKHKTKSFVREEILKLFYKYIPRKTGILTNIQKTHLSALDNIAVIQLEETKLPIEILASKLSKMDGLEYAEAVPKIHFFEKFLEEENLVKEQEHLAQVKALSAWNYLLPSKPIVVAIVDTGIDTGHVDLVENLWTNPGESGLDEFGNNKKNNTIDDDNNGLIDDYFGWDFYDDDNDIMPVHWHGTHVAGLVGATHNEVGVSGVAKNIKLMAVKITGDKDPTDIERNGYEGILYAATMGADIINCSWGGFKYSIAELEAVKLASTVSTIVAAAGNTNTNVSIYPARCKEVLNVAAVNKDDIKANFSTYNKSVDVSAPGQYVLATKMNNTYGRASGTSMASPIAAAIAAMIKNNNPSFNSAQVIAQIKATTDKISKKNPNYINLLGTGRVNALEALTKKANWITVTSYKLNNLQISNTTTTTNNNNNNNTNIICDTNINLILDIYNILNTSKGVYAKVESEYLKFTQDSIYIADSILPNFTLYGQLEISSVLDEDTKNFLLNNKKNEIDIIITFYDSSNINIGYEYISLYLGLDWKHFSKNNIGITCANNGRFAYIDYPNNQIGYGMSYKKYSNLLYQSGVIIATDSNNIFNNITGESSDFQDTTLKFINNSNSNDSNNSTSAFNEFFDSTKKIYYISSKYETIAKRKSQDYKQLEIQQDVFASNSDSLQNSIFIKYTITNKSNKIIDTLYLSAFHDWEIFDVERNKIKVNKNKIVLVTNYKDDSTKPKVGIKLITSQVPTYKSISISGDWGESAIYNNGFPERTKWNYMKNLMVAPVASNSDETDIAMLLGGYEVNIKQDSSVVFTFVITVSEEQNLIPEQINSAINFYKSEIESNSTINKNNNQNSVCEFIIYPNPVTNILKYEITGASAGNYTVRLININGKDNYVLSNSTLLNDFENSGMFEIPSSCSGIYSLVFENSTNKYIKKFVHIK